MDTSKIICILTLFFINLLNYMDRYSVAGVLTRIQHYFSITDASAGLLQTIFIVFFLVFAPISGFIGDRYNRKLIIVCGLVVWVGAVLASSFVPKNAFWLFLLLRGVVGIGEASYSILAPTLIADLFISHARSRAIMFFYFAVPVGSGLGYVIGSSVATSFDNWKWGIRVTPILGLISILAVIFLIEEPERGQAEKEAKEANNIEESPVKNVNSTYLDDLKYLIKIKTYLWSTVGYTSVVFVTGTLAWWAPSAIDYALAMQQNLKDTKDLDPVQKDKVSAIFGAITCIGGIIGVATGTYLAQIWKEGKYCFRNCASPKADPLISGIGALAAVPFLFAGFQLIPRQIELAWVIIFFSVTFVSLNVAINVDMLMYIIVPKRRAIANSWQITISHLFGDASGPYVIGLISDFLRKGDKSPSAHYFSLRTAFYAPTVMLIIAGLAYIICSFTLTEDIKKYSQDMGKKAVMNGHSNSPYPNNLEEFEHIDQPPRGGRQLNTFSAV